MGSGSFTHHLTALEYSPEAECPNTGISYLKGNKYPNFVDLNSSLLLISLNTADSANVGTYNLSLIVNVTLTYNPFILEIPWTL